MLSAAMLQHAPRRTRKFTFLPRWNLGDTLLYTLSPNLHSTRGSLHDVDAYYWFIFSPLIHSGKGGKTKGKEKKRKEKQRRTLILWFHFYSQFRFRMV
ncbi:hypothetical protein VNO80_18077 [Phaseolus coccineus]|uniref:Uncharacterized protein n=1 Tax=Phaseolus coccineus TaxID=3886 RepID=A0AAN9QYK1_PHACN